VLGAIDELLRQPSCSASERSSRRASAPARSGWSRPTRSDSTGRSSPIAGDPAEQRRRPRLVRWRSLTCAPGVLGDAPAGRPQVAEDAGQQARVGLGQDALKIGHLADLQRDPDSGSRRERHRLGVAHERASAPWSSAVAHCAGERPWRLAVEAREQAERREEVQLVRAPEELRERREAVGLDASTAAGRAAQLCVAANCPSRTWRPARPAIWPTSAGVSARGPTRRTCRGR